MPKPSGAEEEEEVGMRKTGRMSRTRRGVSETDASQRRKDRRADYFIALVGVVEGGV